MNYVLFILLYFEYIMKFIVHIHLCRAVQHAAHWSICEFITLICVYYAQSHRVLCSVQCARFSVANVRYDDAWCWSLGGIDSCCSRFLEYRKQLFDHYLHSDSRWTSMHLLRSHVELNASKCAAKKTNVSTNKLWFHDAYVIVHVSMYVIVIYWWKMSNDESNGKCHNCVRI